MLCPEFIVHLYFLLSNDVVKLRSQINKHASNPVENRGQLGRMENHIVLFVSFGQIHIVLALLLIR